MSVEQPNYANLIDSCRKGDKQAQRKVYESLYPKMYGSCLRYIGDKDKAWDVLQEGFIKVFLNLEKYDGNGSFEGWVRRVIVNTAIDVVRKRKFDHISIDDTDYDWLEADDNDEIEWNETLFSERERVMEAIQDLPPAYRAVFNLYVIEDYSHKEIGELLGISTGTSKSNLSKAKHKLKEQLKTIHHR
ncbi:RNA polymerase sigma factor [Salibacter halophilus]|jgi:RNA polymerase sigma-70 factor (ECF subfamily)|uniref:RNA polymerase sigma factor n=1 Tax=Salibacter halophilus TaxID=1803916 RepID=A0A6N6MC45_9FLAO|nr:RNA polymerase sigma factor [Salibacter halophilus]KAB1066127.1 RNA polymerase sigma factor [Salibacter halophilus]